MLTNEQFERTRKLASSLAGIELVERHRELLGCRGRRHGVPDSARMDSLLARVEAGDTAATQRLLCLLTTKFTGFFRNPRHFELATTLAIRAATQNGRARFWTAAAATGEEPWSLAMSLLEGFGCEHPPVTILATDVDIEALAVAERGQYGEAAVQALSPARRERFLRRNCGEHPPWTIAPVLRRMVEFRALNLVSPKWSVTGPFDAIFCRNVLLYLEAHHRQAVLEHLEGLLRPEGLLFLDPTEHLGRAGHRIAPHASGVASGVYSLRTTWRAEP